MTVRAIWSASHRLELGVQKNLKVNLYCQKPMTVKCRLLCAVLLAFHWSILHFPSRLMVLFVLVIKASIFYSSPKIRNDFAIQQQAASFKDDAPIPLLKINNDAFPDSPYR